MVHSAPILANAEALPEILTAKELEAFLRIDVKTIYSTCSAESSHTCGLNQTSASRNTRS
jgi:hypothetical protein